MRRWSPSAQISPRWARGAARAASSAASRSNDSTRSFLSRASSDFSSFASSSSLKPESDRSMSSTGVRSATSRARSSLSQSPEMRLRPRLSTRACSSVRSSQTTGTVFMPSFRAATKRWWPPITVRSSRRASTGCTKPNSRMLRVRASSWASPILRGFAGSGRSESISTSSTCMPLAFTTMTSIPFRRTGCRAVPRTRRLPSPPAAPSPAPAP